MDKEYKTALDHFQNGRFAVAKQLFIKVSEQDPDNIDALFKLGVCNFHLKEFRQAEIRFNIVTNQHPDHSESWYYLGLVYEQQGNHEKAENHYRTALKLNPALDAARKKLSPDKLPSQAEEQTDSNTPDIGQIEPERPIEQAQKLDVARKKLSSREMPSQSEEQIDSSASDISLPDNVKNDSSVNSYLSKVSKLKNRFFRKPSLSDGKDSRRQTKSTRATEQTQNSNHDYEPGELIYHSKRRWFGGNYEFYERQIDIHKGLFFRKKISVRLFSIARLTLSRSLVDFITRNATITIETDTNKKYKLTRLVPPLNYSSKEFANKLHNELRSAVKEQRSLKKTAWM